MSTEDLDSYAGPNFDLLISTSAAHGGKLVVVAKKEGTHVCWQCFQPFGHELDALLGPHEKVIGEIPCLVHKRCVFTAPKVFVDMKVAMRKAEALGAKHLQRAGRKLGILPGR